MRKVVLSIVTLFLTVAFLTSAYSQEEKKQDFRQYLFPAFTVSIVKTSSSKPSKLMLNYNTVTENMVFIQNGEYFDLVTNGVVDTIYMNNKRFIPLEDFYVEVISEGSFTFSIQHRSNLKEPGMPAGYGTTSQLAASNYLSSVRLKSGYYNINIPQGYEVEYSPVYWVQKEGKWYKYLGENQFLKIFPEKSKELKQFIKNNRIKFDKPGDLVKLADYCNYLYK
ncbi:MAG TPA: hypothetical protein P5257_10410 [Bacteroidales bacterium]|nr:hypothetical protein [Bacteroidales bacterium]